MYISLLVYFIEQSTFCFLRLCHISDTKFSIAARMSSRCTFVRRRPELKVKFNRKYDYKRALCEDPQVIRDWFRLVENTKAKYGILDEDTYNSDKAGFLMGMISTGAVVTGSERRGQPKSVQQGNRE
jgi:RecB family endonuclease NucS